MKLPNVEDIYPLSPMQQGLLFHSLYESEAGVYISQTECRITSFSQVDGFKRAWQSVVDRHPILRTCFLWEGVKDPLQVVRQRVKLSWHEEDLRDLDEAEQRRRLEAYVREDARRGFELGRAPLMRWAMFRVDEDAYHFLWSYHHLLLDGWCTTLVLKELFALFEAQERGEEPRLETPRPYREYIAWLQGQDLARAEEFWRSALTGFVEATPLPVDLARNGTPAPGEEDGEETLDLSAELSARLDALARGRRLTLNAVTQGAWGLLLSRYSGRDDVVFGATVSGRPPELEGVESMLGLFINALPVRVRMPPDQTVIDYLQTLQEQQVEARQYEYTPLVNVRDWCGVPRDMPLFESILVFENYPVDKAARTQAGQAMGITSVRSHIRNNYPLTLRAVPRRPLSLEVMYDGRRYGRGTIRRLLRHVARMLEGIATNPEGLLAHLPILTEAERCQLLFQWNETALDGRPHPGVLERFAHRVRAAPDSIAAVFEDERLSYAGLDARAEGLARRLRGLGVGPESRVGLYLERSLELLVGVLGVLKAGGAYVPVDPESPRERTEWVLRDAGVEWVVAQGPLAGRVPETGATVVRVGRGEPAPRGRSLGGVPGSGASGRELAYVIYTSGSTGRPKGVAVEHRQLAHYVAAVTRRLGFSAGESFALVSTPSADLGHTMLFPSLAGGGCLHVVPRGKAADAPGLGRYFEERPIDHLKIVPSHLAALRRASGGASIRPRRLLIVGGEASSPEWVEELVASCPGTSVVNHYGPTEATVGVLTHRVEAGRVEVPSVPLGRPLPGVGAYVLDRSLRAVPARVAGELCLGGGGLARGYLGRPGLTAGSFVPNPYGGTGSRLYRTGDRAWHLGDGRVEFLGRIDHQVKVRGYRVEPGEIESALEAHPGVGQAAVVLRKDTPGEGRLVGYVVGRDGAGPPGGDELRAHVEARLPDYMVPSVFVPLGELPLTPNGKLDRSALPTPEAPSRRAGTGSAAPATEVEQALASIWQEVLGVEGVGVEDNFFELGGDSILCIQVIARARELGYRLTLQQIFQSPTLGGLAHLAEAAGEAAGPGSPRAERAPGPVPLTPIQRWFFEQESPEPHHFNQSVLLTLRERVAPWVLAGAVSVVMDHHDALRLRFERDGAAWRQVRPEEAGVGRGVFVRVDLSGLQAPGAALEALAARVQRSLDLERGPLVRVVHSDLGSAGERLLVVIHHLVVDGVSWRVLLDDLRRAWGQIAQGRSVELPAKSTPFGDWARRLEQYARSTALEEEGEYWRAVASRGVPALPVDHGEDRGTVASLRTASVRLDEERTRQLLQEVPAAYRTQINDVLLTALARALEGWTGSSRVVVELEGHGREELFEEVDLSRTVGWFTTLYPVELDLSRCAGPGEALKAVKEQLRSVPRRGIGYGVLCWLGPEAEAQPLRGRLRPAVRFNYLGQVDQVVSEAGPFAAAPESSGLARSPSGRAPYLLDVSGMVAGGRLRLDWTYSEAVHRRRSIEALAGSYLRSLTGIIEHCLGPEARGYTPSDFPLAGLDQETLDRCLEGLPDVEDVYPLSPLQQGILFHSRYAPGSGVYLEQLSCRIRGELSVPDFRRAWQTLVDRHPVLRTSFVWERLREPLQVVRRNVRLDWIEEDWRELPPEEQEHRVAELVRADRERGFDPGRAPLSRQALLRLGERTYHFTWSYTHALLDGWSSTALIGELFRLYSAFSRGEEPPPERRRPYRDFIAWLLQRDLTGAETFWRRTLEGFTAPTRLAVERPAAPDPGVDEGYSGSEVRLSRSSTSRIEALARRLRVTLNIVVQGAWALLLSRYGGGEDVVFGATASGRPAELEGVDSMLGLFLNTLPVRARIRADQPVSDYLSVLQERQGEAWEHASSALVEIQGWSEVPRGTPLFETLLVFESYPMDRSLRDRGERNDAVLEIDVVEKFDRTGYPLALGAFPGPELRLMLDYERRCFDAAVVQRMAGHLARLLEGMASSPGAPVSGIGLLSEGERLQLLREWNDTGAGFDLGRCFPELWESASLRSPDAVAVTDGGRWLSYGELRARASRLAGRLVAEGVGPESVVAVLEERGTDLLVGFLGILRAGGAYLPLDPFHPPARRAQVVERSGARLVLAGEGWLGEPGLGAGGAGVLPLEAGEGAGREAPAPVLPGQLAYVLFTSGSTGAPKGAMLEHRGLVNHLYAMVRDLDLGPSDRMAQTASQCFDISVWQFLAPLMVGGTVVILRDAVARDPVRLLQAVEARGVSILQVVPSLLREMLHEVAERPETAPRLSSLRWVSPTGESLSPELCRSWFERYPSIPLLNAYGPTECSDDVSLGFLSGAPEGEVGSVSIGRPVWNLRLVVLDERLEPVPLGVPGELCVGGVGVGRGYLGEVSRTAASFVPDPHGGEAGARLYRTGDLGRHLPGGELEFVGRLDHQVKVRGHRIELGEIETVLERHPGVEQAVVVVRDAGAGDRLVGYLVAEGAEAPGARELREYLGARLPEYMVPSAFVELERMPLTPNGKVDRRALPAPEAGSAEPERERVPPRTPVEEVLAGIWTEVLGRERLGVHDDFFELGGHSLLATRIVGRVRDALGVELALRTVFEKPTVAGLAEEALAAMHRGSPVERPPLVPRPPGALLPLSFAQRRLWFLDRLEPESVAYNLATALRIEGPLDVALLGRCLTEIVRRHEVLRTTFEVGDGEPFQVVSDEAVWPLVVVDLEGVPEVHRELEVRRHVREEAAVGFDLERGPVVRGRMLRLGAEDHAVLMTMHHIATDGWSMNVLVREVTTLYAARAAGERARLPDLPIQYADYALWQRSWLDREELESQLRYWREQLDGLAPMLDLPTDRPRPTAQTYHGAVVPFEIPQRVTAALGKLGRREGVTPYMILLAAFQLLLGRYAGLEDVAVGSPIAGRTHRELENLIGFFVNTLVLRTRVSGHSTVRELLEAVREVALEAYAHQDLPFEKLVEEIQPERSLGHNPLFQVMLTLQDAPPSDDLEASRLTLRHLASGASVAKLDLELFAQEAGDRMDCAFQLATDLFDRATIRRMAGHFVTLIDGMVTRPAARVAHLPLLTVEERRQLLVEWNATRVSYPRERCLHELLAEQVERTPDATAVIDRHGAVSYAELGSRADRLAAGLAARGVGPGTLVAVAHERGASLLATLLGIFQAGGAYVPLDPSHPPSRNARILEEARPSLVVAGRAWLAETVATEGCRTLALEDLEGAASGTPGVRRRVDPRDLAYVIFTSGSTGVPKGAMVEHRGLVNHLFAKVRDLDLSAGDRVAQSASQCFDISVWQFFSALVLGGTTCVVDDETAHDPERLLDAVDEAGITVLEVVPSLLRGMVEGEARGAPATPRLGGLRWLIATGEALVPELCREWLDRHPAVPVMNAYGPTECSDDVSHAVIERAAAVGLRTVPIGRPIGNTRLHVLDRRLEPVPMGLSGELLVAGDGVGRGYLHDPAKTAQAFLPDPLGTDPGARLYRTGDRARHLPDGEIEFLGRLDHQVKVRGFRIEPGEIESALESRAEVTQAVVVAREGRQGEPRLVAYLVAQDGALPGVRDLRESLAAELPDYMVPSAFVELERVPLTANGKIDRRALPAPDRARPDLDRVFVAPDSAVEQALATVWEEVLSLDRVGAHDNFFELGGDSFQMMKVVARARERGLRIAPNLMFRFQTVSELADGLYSGAENPSTPLLVPFSTEGDGPPFFCVHPAGGRVQFFWPLAREIGRDRPFYGVRSRSLEGAGPHRRCVEEMAADYVEQMRAVQPHGPYHLGGYSLGVFLSFEMARQLAAAGEEVGLLALLDAAVYRPPPEDPYGIRHLVTMASEHGRVSLDAEELRQVLPDRLMDHVLREIEEGGAVHPEGLEILHAVAPVAYVNQLAVDDYMTRIVASPEEYRCPVEATVFCTVARPPGESEAPEPNGGWDARSEPDFGWGRYCSSVETHTIPGDHHSILSDPDVLALAEVLRGCLDRSEVAESPAEVPSGRAVEPTHVP